MLDSRFVPLKTISTKLIWNTTEYITEIMSCFFPLSRKGLWEEELNPSIKLFIKRRELSEADS